MLSVLVSTSNWISRLFFSGLNEVRIEINPLASGYFFKREKVAAFQWSPDKIGMEAKAVNYKS